MLALETLIVHNSLVCFFLKKVHIVLNLNTCNFYPNAHNKLFSMLAMNICFNYVFLKLARFEWFSGVEISTTLLSIISITVLGLGFLTGPPFTSSCQTKTIITYVSASYLAAPRISALDLMDCSWSSPAYSINRPFGWNKRAGKWNITPVQTNSCSNLLIRARNASPLLRRYPCNLSRSVA